MKFFNLRNTYMVFFTLILILGALLLWFEKDNNIEIPLRQSEKNLAVKIFSPPKPTSFNLSTPESFIIPVRHHTFQTFNNCGPATLSMALSYWGIDISQHELGNVLRPYQVAGGDNDDKSVTLHEVADYAREYGLHFYLRPNGTPEKLEKFISQGIPVITRTWLKPNEDIGHYRVIRGYDRNLNHFIQDDSLQGKNLTYTYDEFNSIWQPFNYEYLIIVDNGKKEIAEKILGDELDENVAWQNALTRIEREINENPDNRHLIFAKSRIHYYLGDYKKSVEEFEKVESQLSFRTLWYQIEPILSYFELKNYDRVFALTDEILNNENRAFSELYHLRGQIYLSQGNSSLAKSEFEKAIKYKYNYQPSIDALASL